MDEQMRRRLEISLRLKAARFLAGGHRVRANSASGKPEAIALPIKELAKRAPLPENRITANKLLEIEEMKTHVTPSQVALIGQALGVELDGLPVLNPQLVPATDEEPADQPVVGPAGAPLLETIESQTPPAHDQSETTPAAGRRKTA